MQNIVGVWSSLSIARQVALGLATLLVFALVLGVGRLAARPTMTVLYSGLEPGIAGEVIANLDAAGITFDIRGDTIWVPVVDRDRLRLSLAAEGLPAAGGQGYELLDSLSGFGTTSQMFDAAYWRAKEGELARTITAAPWARAARVHVASGSTPFGRAQVGSASVTVVAASGAVTAAQADTLRHLVAAAVPNLAVEDVAVIDSKAGLVSPEDPVAGQGVADRRAQTLRETVLRLIEARVGPGRAVVEVSVDTVRDREQISERIIDPESRVAISEDTEERAGQSTDAGRGAVTVASNLPDGDAAGGTASSESSDTETRQVTNYEVSETRREILREPGAIRRISVAVMVDGLTVIDEEGQPSWQPRPDAELEDLRQLIVTAAGLDETRGDSLIVKTMAFERPPTEEVAVIEASIFDGIDKMQIAQLATVIFLALIMALFIIRPVLSSGRRLPAPLPESEDMDAASARVLNAKEATPTTPADRLRQLMSERQPQTLKVLNDWVQDDGTSAG